MFSSINYFFKDKYKDWFVKIDEEDSKLIVETTNGDFKFSNEEDLLEKTLEKLNMNDVKVYKLQRLASFSTAYFLISNAQKKALNSLFKTQLF